MTSPPLQRCSVLMHVFKTRSLQVGAVEFGDKLLGALYIVDGAPFIFFNAIALPAY